MTATALETKFPTTVAAPSRRLVLELGSDMSFDDWADVGARIARICGGAAWALGDWLLFGERRYGERYRSALEATNLDYQTLRNYAWVARSIAPARRREGLSFQHHAEVAALPAAEQDLWLHRAEAQEWSRNELRRQLSAQRLARRAEAAKPAVVVRVEVPSDHAARWRSAAAAAQQGLPEWLREVADAAAERIAPAG
ncbi:LmbU family transcriptional regulator [Solirubrobacter ginsenosidimutans]|uniref:LmbU family transcriptional regulator n=1 Tax=Solirubrobacter ginsenosidimutans TaxID=490573 RepID=A0A9X3MRK2_9ACTN|nr:LmbU family transcriptional regulator [Solirubrobacter ginsenosidimutans]MDA0161676.1 LmbU family transcriptional regulator [Solirubrobacter ginsenosidimutans]